MPSGWSQARRLENGVPPMRVGVVRRDQRREHAPTRTISSEERERDDRGLVAQQAPERARATGSASRVATDDLVERDAGVLDEVRARVDVARERSVGPNSVEVSSSLTTRAPAG